MTWSWDKHRSFSEHSRHYHAQTSVHETEPTPNTQHSHSTAKWGPTFVSSGAFGNPSPQLWKDEKRKKKKNYIKKFKNVWKLWCFVLKKWKEEKGKEGGCHLPKGANWLFSQILLSKKLKILYIYIYPFFQQFNRQNFSQF